MLVYTVHEPPEPPMGVDERADALVFVKEGFSTPAFLFGPFWLARHRLWLALVLYVAGLLFLLGVFQILPGGNGAIGSVLTLASFGFGLEANAIRRWGLERCGYQMIGTAAGKTFEECEHRFLTGWLSGQTAKSMPTATGIPAVIPLPVPPAGGAVSLAVMRASFNERSGATPTAIGGTAMFGGGLVSDSPICASNARSVGWLGAIWLRRAKTVFARIKLPICFHAIWPA